MRCSTDESDLSNGQRRKSARSLDFCLQRSAKCEGFQADERDCATTSSSINDVLRRKLLQQKTSNSAEVTAKAAWLERLDRWHRDLKSAGFCGELTSLTSKHSPFEDLDHTTISDRVLVLYPSNIHTYDVKTGPFQPVRLVIYVNGAWSLQCPIFEHTRPANYPHWKLHKLSNLLKGWYTPTTHCVQGY